MGSIKFIKESKLGGFPPGKIKASLDETLKAVKWGEYKIGDVFYVQTYKKRFDANKVKILDKGKYPYVVRMSGNNGQKGFIEAEKEYLNEGNTLSFGQDTATVFYQEKPYFTGDKIKILKSKYERFGKKNAQFFVAAITKAFSSFSWGTSSYSIDVIENQVIKLPILNNNINFDFMESFIAELEAERIAELNAYLSASGLDNYELSDKEKSALADFESLEWKDFKLTEILTPKNTRSILSSSIKEDSGTTPYLCASAENNSVSSYIDYDKNMLDEGNCIFIGGKTFVISYQKEDFYSNDSHNLALYLINKKYREKLPQLYLATCIYKSLKHKYSWGDSISKQKIQADFVTLPIKDNQPNYEIMETFISAVEKLVIKDVVLYANQKVEATKKVVER